VITAAGREYLTVVREALDQIALGTERLLRRQRRRSDRQRLAGFRGEVARQPSEPICRSPS
jgi:hypothetical protein